VLRTADRSAAGEAESARPTSENKKTPLEQVREFVPKVPFRAPFKK
jgi:hypothetical protein